RTHLLAQPTRVSQYSDASIMSNSTGKANHQRRAQQCPGFKSVIAQKECPRDDLRYLMEGACAPAHDPRKIKPPDVFFTAHGSSPLSSSWVSWPVSESLVRASALPRSLAGDSGVVSASEIWSKIYVLR